VDESVSALVGAVGEESDELLGILSVGVCGDLLQAITFIRIGS
jgi:hypothetical protein